jgi:hypothetical protein
MDIKKNVLQKYYFLFTFDRHSAGGVGTSVLFRWNKSPAEMFCRAITFTPGEDIEGTDNGEPSGKLRRNSLHDEDKHGYWVIPNGPCGADILVRRSSVERACDCGYATAEEVTRERVDPLLSFWLLTACALLGMMKYEGQLQFSKRRCWTVCAGTIRETCEVLLFRG